MQSISVLIFYQGQDLEVHSYRERTAALAHAAGRLGQYLEELRGRELSAIAIELEVMLAAGRVDDAIERWNWHTTRMEDNRCIEIYGTPLR